VILHLTSFLIRLSILRWINNFSALWQVVTTLAIVISLVAYPTERNTDEFVWFHVINETGFPDKNIGYVFLLGLLSATFSFSGYEAGAHMAEETTNASKVTPEVEDGGPTKSPFPS
jgi:amino acid transporter